MTTSLTKPERKIADGRLIQGAGQITDAERKALSKLAGPKEFKTACSFFLDRSIEDAKYILSTLWENMGRANGLHLRIGPLDLSVMIIPERQQWEWSIRNPKFNLSHSTNSTSCPTLQEAKDQAIEELTVQAYQLIGYYALPNGT